jgi:hypothetical protein
VIGEGEREDECSGKILKHVCRFTSVIAVQHGNRIKDSSSLLVVCRGSKTSGGGVSKTACIEVLLNSSHSNPIKVYIDFSSRRIRMEKNHFV